MVGRVYQYQLIDVFSDTPFCGNPLAVFTDAQGLSTDLMQKIARELNLSETTFVLPSSSTDYDYAVRIFTPTSELTMAGHPTIGTAFALAHVDKLDDAQRVVFEEGVGPVSVTMMAPMTTMQHPMPEYGGEYSDREAAAASLTLSRSDLLAGAPVQAISCGVPFTLIPIRDLDALQRIQFRADIWSRTIGRSEAPHVMAFTLDAPAPSVARCRVFAPALGVTEDPATGSACGSLGAYIVRHRMVDYTSQSHFVMTQGVEMGRPSQVHVILTVERDKITSLRVGGQCVWAGRGEIHISPISELPAL
jgi:trans-2,3-dihydro-3-hydroxyanthranilate isomerase